MPVPLRILMVEDNPGDVLWMRITLDELAFPYLLKVSETAQAGIAALGESRPDILFVDLNLPGMCGEELLARLRSEIEAGLPVCILTGSILERKRVRAQYGLDPRCYILKPINALTFVDALDCFSSTRGLAERLRANGNAAAAMGV